MKNKGYSKFGGGGKLGALLEMCNWFIGLKFCFTALESKYFVPLVKVVRKNGKLYNLQFDFSLKS